MNHVHLLVYTVVGGLPSTSAACYALNSQYVSTTLIKNTDNKTRPHILLPYICKSNELNEIPNKNVSRMKQIKVQPK
jgi:hypothetical protein